MANLSLEITGKIRSCLFVLSALFQQGPAVAEILRTKVLGTLSEGQEPAGFLAQILILGQLLKAELDLMVEIDKKLVREQRLRFALLQSRDDKSIELGKRVRGVRRIITGHFVEPDVTQLGVGGTVSREPVALLRHADMITEQLQREDLDDLLGDPLFEPRHDPRPCGPQIAPFMADLREAHEVHQRSTRRVDELLAQKKKAVETYDTAFVRVTRQFEDMCRLAGENELADKVRPSATRKGETAVKPADGEVPDSSDEAVGASGESPSEPVSEPVSEPTSESVSEPVSGSASDQPDQSDVGSASDSASPS